MHQEDAFKFITHCLRNNVSIADYGYDVYLIKVMQEFLNQ